MPCRAIADDRSCDLSFVVQGWCDSQDGVKKESAATKKQAKTASCGMFDGGEEVGISRGIIRATPLLSSVPPRPASPLPSPSPVLRGSGLSASRSLAVARLAALDPRPTSIDSAQPRLTAHVCVCAWNDGGVVGVS